MQIEPAPPSNHAEAAPRLLIVEPNRSALAVLARRLGEAGYRVIACDNAGNAIAELHRAAGRPGARRTAHGAGQRGRADPAGARRHDAQGHAGHPDHRPHRQRAARSTALPPGPTTSSPSRSISKCCWRGSRGAIARARAVRELRQDNAALDARVIDARDRAWRNARRACRQAKRERLRLAAMVVAPRLTRAREIPRSAARRSSRGRARSPDWRARSRPCRRNRGAPHRPSSAWNGWRADQLGHARRSAGSRRPRRARRARGSSITSGWRM